MKNKKFTIHMLSNWLLVFCFCLMLTAQIFRSSISHVIVVVISLVAIILGRQKLSKFSSNVIIFLFFYFFYGLLTVFVTNGGMGGIYSVISGIIVFCAAHESKMGKLQYGVAFVFMMFTNIYWIVNSPGYYAKFFYNHWKGDSSIINANGIGIIICYTSILLFIILGQSKSIIIRGIRWFLYFLSMWGINNTRSRMALVTAAMFLLLNLILNFKKINRDKFLRVTFIGAIACQIGFPFVYLFMYFRGYGDTIYSYGLHEKGLYSGRETIWFNAFRAMHSAKDWIIGIGSKHDFWEGHVLNLHNNAMNLLVVLGMIGLIVYFVFLYKIVFDEYDAKKKALWQNQLVVYFICIMLEGCTDITLFYNDFLLYVFLPLGIACGKFYDLEPDIIV